MGSVAAMSEPRVLKKVFFAASLSWLRSRSRSQDSARRRTGMPRALAARMPCSALTLA